MITKEEAKNKLKKAGYNVVDDNSVLAILISEKASVKNTVKSVKELLLKLDYQASFGVKQHSGSIEETTTDATEFDDTTELLDGEVFEETENQEVSDSEEVVDDSKDSKTSEEYAEVIEEHLEAKSNSAIKEKDAAVKKKNSTKKTESAKSKKKKESLDSEEDEFFDDEDENFDKIDSIKLDDLDLDMMLNEDSVQFSLEDFGLM